MPEAAENCRTCGCTEAAPCPSGCARVRRDLCSECLPLEEAELAMLSDLLIQTTTGLIDLPWRAYLRALDDPKTVEALAPVKLSPERRVIFMRHLREMASQASTWKEAACRMRAEMKALGPTILAATPDQVPPAERPPREGGGLRIVRP